ncbi:unnamed protein product [Durusdinium trenchii]|uniref:Uncharacterized protein n=1 Tax=Durusdinium trenchii TaxID=1381693 RepID=A0ABP0KFV8_9DINO
MKEVAAVALQKELYYDPKTGQEGVQFLDYSALGLRVLPGCGGELAPQDARTNREACFLVILLAETILLRMGVSVLGIFLHSFNSITRAGEIIWEICGPETKVARILLLVIGFMLHEIYRPPPDPVVLWKRFASPHECDALLELAGGLPHLPALAAGAPQGTIRRSLSKALHWDHHPQLAAFQARMLAAAQNWTGEDRLDPSVLAIGEPMNLAAYLNPGGHRLRGPTPLGRFTVASRPVNLRRPASSTAKWPTKVVIPPSRMVI